MVYENHKLDIDLHKAMIYKMHILTGSQVFDVITALPWWELPVCEAITP